MYTIHDSKNNVIATTRDIFAQLSFILHLDNRTLTRRAALLAFVSHTATDGPRTKLEFGKGFQPLTVTGPANTGSFTVQATPAAHYTDRGPLGRRDDWIFTVQNQNGGNFSNWNRNDIPHNVGAHPDFPMIDQRVKWSGNNDALLHAKTLTTSAGCNSLVIEKHFTRTSLFAAFLNGDEAPEITLTPDGNPLFAPLQDGQGQGNTPGYALIADGEFLRFAPQAWSHAENAADMVRRITELVSDTTLADTRLGDIHPDNNPGGIGAIEALVIYPSHPGTAAKPFNDV